MTKPTTYETVRVSPSSPGIAALRIAHGAGLLCIVAALVLVVGSAVTQMQFAVSAVPDDSWRFPWSPTAFIVTTVIWATAQAAIVPALATWQRSGSAGPGSAARWGIRLVGLVMAAAPLVTLREFTGPSAALSAGDRA